MQHFKALRIVSLILGFSLVAFGCATSKNQVNVPDRTAFIGTWNFAFDYDGENDHVQYVISADTVQYEYFVNGTSFSFTMSDITWIAEEDPYGTLYPNHPADIPESDPYKNLYPDYQAGYIIEGTITANSSYDGNIWPEGIGEIRRIPIAMHKTDSQNALISLDFCAKQL